MSPAFLAKAAASILTSEKSRKAVGWAAVAVLSPIILLLVFFCALLSGGAEHNRTAVDLCFHGGAIPEGTPAEYRAYIEDMRDSFALLDAAMQAVEGQMEDGDTLDDIRVKAVFYALYFGTENPETDANQGFVDCSVTYEERTRTVTTVDEDGNEVEIEETYTVALPISDVQQVWQNIQQFTGAEVTTEQQSNADSVYNIVKYGASTGTEGWIPGADVPYIGADGFCSPSVTPLSPIDSHCIPNVSQCHACPLAATCNPLRVEYMEQKLRNAIAYLDGWNDGTYIVTVDTNDFDVLRHCYDLRSVIAGLSVILHEALGLPLGDLPRWEDQYPVVFPNVKSRKGRD